MIVECRLVHTIELGLHTQFVGVVADVKVDEAALGSDGKADIQRSGRWCSRPIPSLTTGSAPSLPKPSPWARRSEPSITIDPAPVNSSLP